MMDNKKAKKAVELALMQKLMAEASPINPEIQAMAPAMQPADGLLNPYARIGTVPANMYSPGNMIDGSPLGEARAVARELMP